jgi:hypothetical protein
VAKPREGRLLAPLPELELGCDVDPGGTETVAVPSLVDGTASNDQCGSTSGLLACKGTSFDLPCVGITSCSSVLSVSNFPVHFLSATLKCEVCTRAPVGGL